MRILIKIWWSIIAPKDRKDFNEQALQNIIKNLPYWNIYHIAHGTGNIWHGFVKNNLMTEENISILQKNLSNYEQLIDTYFPLFHRTSYWEILTQSYDTKSIIVSGTILGDGLIISSDLIIKLLAEKYAYDYIIILTNIDWVIDNKWNIIPHITINNLNSIFFRSNENDVTWNMRWKLQELLSIENKNKVPIWIINGLYPERLANIIYNKESTWTRVDNDFS